MENLSAILNSYGSIASILSIIIIFIGYTRKKLKIIKQEKKNLEKKYEEYRSEINRLAKNAATTTKRQDLFIYINETLSSFRHSEIKMRIKTIPMYYSTGIILFSSIIYFIFQVKGIEEITLKTIFAPTIFVLCSSYMSIICFRISTLIEQISNVSESISRGYIEAVHEHIGKTLT